MPEDVVIRAEGLGKRYVIGHQHAQERYTSLRDVISRNARNFGRSVSDILRGRANVAGDELEEFWALKDVDFEIRRGDVVGVIGRNGAGKSTLLKILSRITEPSEGRVTIEGRVASLLEVGTGFHPELSGRENIYLNGAILGMTRAEIKKKFDEIVAFAEVEKFLDTPVKRYSSGMYVRLAFAVAAHLEPEILIVDEVLAVGDARFQKKCLGKMQDVAGHGRTVLFVSHNMAAIQSLCQSGLLFIEGGLECAGAVEDVVSAYADKPSVRHKDHIIKVESSLEILDARVAPDPIPSGTSADLLFRFRASQPGLIRECALLVCSSGLRVGIVDLRGAQIVPLSYGPGTFVLSTRLEHLDLVEGTYSIGLYIVSDRYSGSIDDIASFQIVPSLGEQTVTPYPASSRGIWALQATSSVMFECGRAAS